MLLMILRVKRLWEHFMKKNCKRLTKKKIRKEKVIKRQGDKLYVKWKGYNSSFNSWMNKKYLL